MTLSQSRLSGTRLRSPATSTIAQQTLPPGPWTSTILKERLQPRAPFSLPGAALDQPAAVYRPYLVSLTLNRALPCLGGGGVLLVMLKRSKMWLISQAAFHDEGTLSCHAKQDPMHAGIDSKCTGSDRVLSMTGQGT